MMIDDSSRVSTPAVCLIVALVTLGCGSSPVAPTAAPSPAPAPTPTAPTSVTVRIVSGVTEAPVTGARVVVGGNEHQTDEGGAIEIPASAVESTLAVQAAGYLPRSTRLARGVQSVRLWPVANETEASIVRQMAFNNRSVPDHLYGFDPASGLIVTMRSSPAADIVEAWRAEALAFAASFNMRATIGTSFNYESYEIDVMFDDPRCTPSLVLGFCRIPSAYMVYNVATERATDPVTIRRALASLFLAPNPFPGLLNPQSPGSTLSGFERQTIAMILQRPRTTRWPDDDLP